MKKIIQTAFYILIAILFVSCSGDSNNSFDDTNNPNPPAPTTPLLVSKILNTDSISSEREIHNIYFSYDSDFKLIGIKGVQYSEKANVNYKYSIGYDSKKRPVKYSVTRGTKLIWEQNYTYIGSTNIFRDISYDPEGLKSADLKNDSATITINNKGYITQYKGMSFTYDNNNNLEKSSLEYDTSSSILVNQNLPKWFWYVNALNESACPLPISELYAFSIGNNNLKTVYNISLLNIVDGKNLPVETTWNQLITLRGTEPGIPTLEGYKIYYTK